MSRLIEHSGMNTKSFFSLLGCIVLGTVLFSFAAEADESLAVASSPESVPGFSGVAYFFGRKLHAETGVPVGLIARALGGTPVEWWTPVDKLRRVPFAKAALANPSQKWMKYEQAVAQWQKNVKASDRKAAGKKPEAVGSPEEQVLASIYAPGKAGSLYAQHLEPIAGYGIRGAIWYQGERNSKAGKKASRAYRPLLANMITSWREEWGQGDFPFLAVQLPTFSGGSEGWAIVQDGQAAAVSDVPNAGYIDISDQPDDGLHPKNKKPVGERLADLALEEFLD
jgi:sialate O-acetylesterase